MRRALLVLVLAIAAIGVFAAGLATLLDTPGPPRGASRGERLFYGLCVTCHGTDGRGSWRAAPAPLRATTPAARPRAVGAGWGLTPLRSGGGRPARVPRTSYAGGRGMGPKGPGGTAAGSGTNGGGSQRRRSIPIGAVAGAE